MLRAIGSRWPVVGLAILLSACASGPVDVQTAESVPLAIDKSDPERLMRSLLGGYVDGADPFEAGLLTGSGDDLVLHPQLLSDEIRASLADANGDGALDWDEMVPFFDATYAEGHGLPSTLEAFYAATGVEAPASSEDSLWFTVDIDGVMTSARRRVSVPMEALRSAMNAFVEGGELVYPTGTPLIGVHLGEEGETLETTVKRRRADGFWDFAVYGADGQIAEATSTPPLPLKAPTQCTGCHLGQKLYEPEKSFPAEAADGPNGPRAYYVPDSWRSPEATALFQEHARRDDGVLGLYATLYAGRLMTERVGGTIAPEDAALLDRLGL
ncbi:MAG: hypothetical protein AAF170_15325 [Bacteroidota bacterium]